MVHWLSWRAILLGTIGVIALMSCGEKSTPATAVMPIESARDTESKDHSNPDSTVTKPTSSSDRRAKLIYKKYCNQCHGIDGRQQLNGAKDLSVSAISLDERVQQITHGKGLMTPYKDILSEEQILLVAEYIETLRIQN